MLILTWQSNYYIYVNSYLKVSMQHLLWILTIFYSYLLFVFKLRNKFYFVTFYKCFNYKYTYVIFIFSSMQGYQRCGTKDISYYFRVISLLLPSFPAFYQSLIKMFLSTVKAVKLEVRPLFLPQLVRLTAMLKPGLHSINVSFTFSLRLLLILALPVAVDKSELDTIL